jgi:hypothetical protein
VNHDDNKWFELWSIMRLQKIGAMITGEAHMNAERKAAFEGQKSDTTRLQPGF